jgi:hypothetical protein
LPRDRAQALEIAFAAVFSAVILVVFYSLISMNGLVLGNDPAVHLERAQDFLRTGQIPLANLGWTPPLYQILLAMLISFTGANSLEQMIFLVKSSAVVIDWLLFFSVYLIGAKFFSRRIGAVAAVLLLMSFPMFEINLWGGYTSVLGISFMVLLLLYLPSAVKSFGYLLVTFVVAFSVVLSHQLAAFLSIIILAPIILVLLIKSRGTYLKALIALILGGGTAFFLYYFQAMLPYLGGVIAHLFFLQKTTIYQVSATTLNAFMVNFGFIFLVALCGMFISFFHLRTQRKLTLWLILFLSSICFGGILFVWLVPALSMVRVLSSAFFRSFRRCFHGLRARQGFRLLSQISKQLEKNSTTNRNIRFDCPSGIGISVPLRSSLWKDKRSQHLLLDI